MATAAEKAEQFKGTPLGIAFGQQSQTKPYWEDWGLGDFDPTKGPPADYTPAAGQVVGISAGTRPTTPTTTPADASAEMFAGFASSMESMKATFAEQMRSLRGEYDTRIALMKREQEQERRRRQKEATFRAQRAIGRGKGSATGGGGFTAGGTALSGIAGSMLGGTKGKTLLGL